MRRICFSVGVGDAQQLAYLPGARNGAEAFGSWARQFGYQTDVLTDEQHPVTVEIFRQRLEGLLANAIQQPIERAIIYFAGHGLTQGAADDLWLLSTWFRSQEAVNVNGLVRKLDRYNISQLVVVSDACRSLPTGAQDADLTEHKVLPRGPVLTAVSPQADHWRASSPYRAAFMVRGANGGQDRCIFSGVLTDALWGYYSAAFDPASGGGRITSWSLAKCLRVEVPLVASRYMIDGQPISLNPDLRPGLWPPDDVYVQMLPPGRPPITEWPAGGAVAQGGEEDRIGTERPAGETWSTRAPYLGTADADLTRPAPDSGARGDPKLPGFDDRLLVEANAARNAKFEESFRAWSSAVAEHSMLLPTTLPAFTVFESGSADVPERSEEMTAYSATDVLHIFSTATYGVPGGSFRSEIVRPLDHPAPLLIRLSGERYFGAALYSSGQTDFYVTDRGVEGLMIAHDRRRWDDPGIFSFGELESARAILMLQSDSLSRSDAERLAEGLRFNKHSNPVAGVIAAYLYNRFGDIDNIRRIALYYIRAQQPVPFDIALLARVDSVRDADGQISIRVPSVGLKENADQEYERFTWDEMEGGHGKVAGAFPWLRQGWILLDDEGEGALYPPGLSRLGKYLLPAPFTTLRGQAGRALGRWLRNGAGGPVE